MSLNGIQMVFKYGSNTGIPSVTLECRARPDLPEIRLFWTSTWGEEDRVLVDLEPSPSVPAGWVQSILGILF